MAASVNKVILVGNLGNDPEVRLSPDGGKIVNLSVATTDSWKDKTTGKRCERTEWNKVVVFNEKLAEVCEKFLKKGSKIYLEGKLQTRKWTDKQGNEKYTTEIVLARYQGEITLLSFLRDNDGSQYNIVDEPNFPSLPSLPLSSAYLNDDVPF